jgi:hypothetical protein
MEEVTRANPNRSLAMIIGGEVVTVHKIRSAISGGLVRIANCDEKAGMYLLQQLRKR